MRVEAGMHTAIARHVGVSADGKRMVSASYDKTIRVWSIPDGKLENVFRVPIGEGFEGSIFAIALSPDGKTIAAGGWMKQQYVYLIDATNGQIIRTLGPNTEVTMQSRFLARWRQAGRGLRPQFGMRMYDVATGALLAEDKNYSDDTNGLAFSENGTFATAPMTACCAFTARTAACCRKSMRPAARRFFGRLCGRQRQARRRL